MVQKLDHVFDLPKLRAEINQVLSQMDFESRQVKQLLVTCPEYSQDPDFFGTGKIYDTVEKKYHVPQEDFRIINPRFAGSYLEHVWKTFPYKIGRVRVMMLTPKHSYSLHRDAEARFHIAVNTQSDCYLIYKGQPRWYHVPADGHLYRVETHVPHSAMNCSPTTRTHIVFDALEAYPI